MYRIKQPIAMRLPGGGGCWYHVHSARPGVRLSHGGILFFGVISALLYLGRRERYVSKSMILEILTFVPVDGVKYFPAVSGYQQIWFHDFMIPETEPVDKALLPIRVDNSDIP